MSTDTSSGNEVGAREKWLFWGCFISLITTAFGFIIRASLIESGVWTAEFNLSNTQAGEIFGVGLWPFAISIIIFSLIIDKIGYGWAMVFAFVCHVVSAVMTIMADGYWGLYWATFIVALGNGTVEAVINPVVATLFNKEKTKWLNILHAGWPGGLVLAGFIMLAMGDIDWRWKVGTILVPAVVYGIMLVGRKFPINERVEAGVSYREMCSEVGSVGALILAFIMMSELTRVFLGEYFTANEWGVWQIRGLNLGLSFLLCIPYIYFVRGAPGRWMFIFLLLIMIPLATTELGTDSWIGDLMKPEMAKMGLAGLWVLIYTSAIMMILRFFAGPIVHKLSPLGLLAVSSVLAAGGLVFLSKATGITILIAATLYGFGKTFFWPTMLGVVAERFPKGGALSLNAIGGMGMLSVGVIGAALLGNIQDKTIDSNLKALDPALHATVVGDEKMSVFGAYQSVMQDKLMAATDEQKEKVTSVQEGAKKEALMTVAILPCIMFVCYMLLIFYFKARGGYSAVQLESGGGGSGEGGGEG